MISKQNLCRAIETNCFDQFAACEYGYLRPLKLYELPYEWTNGIVGNDDGRTGTAVDGDTDRGEQLLASCGLQPEQLAGAILNAGLDRSLKIVTEREVAVGKRVARQRGSKGSNLLLQVAFC